MRVLVADDDTISRKVMERELTRWGYEVILAEDGKQAWQVLQGEAAPPLALLDWTMPEMTGLQVCREVRHRSSSNYTYLILVTGRCREGDLAEGMEAGADDYLCKPFNASELKARLKAAQRIIELQERVRSEIEARQAQQELHVQELHDREQHLQAILTSLQETVILVLDADGLIKHEWSDASMSDRYNIDLASSAGKHLADLFSPDDARRQLERIKTVFQTGQPFRNEDYLTFDTGHFWQDISISPISDSRGNVTAVIAFMRDITNQKAMREDLHQARQLEAVGQLAAGIAHEINTPMQFAGDNTRFCRESFVKISNLLTSYSRLLAEAKTTSLSPGVVEEVEQAAVHADMSFLAKEVPIAIEQSLEGIDRVTTIVHAMREFSQPGVEQKTAVNLNDAITSTITICRNEWKYVADLETNYDPNILPIICRPAEINQSLLSVIINASDAIKEKLGTTAQQKGRITITTKQLNDCVEMQVSDNGAGIPDSVKPNIFSPFFSTKEVGHGTGQGLASARSVIVDHHGGTIDFESIEGEGTTFTIRLPLSQPDTEGLPRAGGAPGIETPLPKADTAQNPAA